MFDVQSSDFDRSTEQTTIELDAKPVCLKKGTVAGRRETQITELEGDAQQVVIEAFGIDDDAEIMRDTCACPFEDAGADEGQMHSAEERQRERNNRRNGDQRASQEP